MAMNNVACHDPMTNAIWVMSDCLFHNDAGRYEFQSSAAARTSKQPIVEELYSDTSSLGQGCKTGVEEQNADRDPLLAEHATTERLVVADKIMPVENEQLQNELRAMQTQSEEMQRLLQGSVFHKKPPGAAARKPCAADEKKQGQAGPRSTTRHIARLPTQDLIEQVDQRNHNIEELLKMGEETISATIIDTSPLSKRSYVESEDGESPSKRLRIEKETSWEDLGLAADTVLRSLGDRLNVIAELSDYSASSSTSQSSEGEDEYEFAATPLTKRTASWTSFYAVDEDAVEVQTLDCVDWSVDKQCIVGHKMMPHRTPSDRWWCSKCLKQVPKGTRLFGCRICNWDECSTCLNSAEVEARCEPCTAPEEGLSQDVASLQQQMSALQKQLREVIKERDAEMVKNQKLQEHVSRMWKATLAYSDFPGSSE